MKVAIHFNIEVDEADWAMNYGIDKPKEVRADVKQFAEQIVIEQFRASGINVR